MSNLMDDNVVNPVNTFLPIINWKFAFLLLLYMLIL